MIPGRDDRHSTIGSPATTTSAATARSDRLRGFVELTKPRITGLLLVTCIASMLVATRGVPSIGLLVATAIGLALSGGGASALNHVLDRDIDAVMIRTRQRPVVRGVIGPAEGALFGCALMAAGFVTLWLEANPLAAWLSLFGGGFYVLGYTVVLKRSTVQNIVIGGAAGAAPPLVGWAAVAGSIDAVAWALFAIVFLWTPPHFWALAILIRDDYARAKVPMLPVVRGERATAVQILLYSVVLTVASFVPVVVNGGLGPIYALVAIALGARFLQLAWGLRRATVAGAGPGDVRASARRVFLYSMGYLGALFVAAVVDALVWG